MQSGVPIHAPSERAWRPVVEQELDGQKKGYVHHGATNNTRKVYAFREPFSRGAYRSQRQLVMQGRKGFCEVTDTETCQTPISYGSLQVGGQCGDMGV